jgi:hypothetical protein
MPMTFNWPNQIGLKEGGGGVKLDTTFANEIRKQANGNGSKEHRIMFAMNIAKVAKELENSRYEFYNCLKKYGRVNVALCVAATIMRFPYKYENHQITWAQMVLAQWTNRTPAGSIANAVFNMHPAILMDISSSLRRLTITE